VASSQAFNIGGTFMRAVFVLFDSLMRTALGCYGSTGIKTPNFDRFAQKGVTLPDGLDAKHQGMVDKMAALTGSEFDNAYITGMIKDHKMDAKEFKAESAETKDADIKSFVDKSIPVVAEHLKAITAMKK
jgi:hypothetical protein